MIFYKDKNETQQYTISYEHLLASAEIEYGYDCGEIDYSINVVEVKDEDVVDAFNEFTVDYDELRASVSYEPGHVKWATNATFSLDGWLARYPLTTLKPSLFDVRVYELNCTVKQDHSYKIGSGAL